MFRKIALTLGVCLATSLTAYSQKVQIQDIIIKGNKHTKSFVITTELDHKVGDSIEVATLASYIESNEKRILSTGLFNTCKINIKDWQEEKKNIILSIEVNENWYIYPAPVFEIADRNFNVWWKEMNASLKRTNYGARIDHLNVLGYSDKLKLQFHTGYTQKYEADYHHPYLIKNWGLGANIFYSENKEIGYKSQANKIIFKKFDDERIALKRLRLGLSSTNRIDAYTNQFIYFEYHYRSVDKAVVNDLNPSYFPNGDDYIRYLKLEYWYRKDKTVSPIYPEGGHLYEIGGIHNGFGIGNFTSTQMSIFYGAYHKLKNKIILGMEAKVRYTYSPKPLPYSNNSSIGYGKDKLRGYDLYVVDGPHFFWVKSLAKYALYKDAFSLKNSILKKMGNLPISIFGRVSTEIGYGYEPTYKDTNFLNNKIIAGFGPAIDLILYNNYILSIEYNGNIEGEWGWYFNSAFGF